MAVGRRLFIVQYRIDLMVEREIVDTDANMGARSAPWTTAEADEAADLGVMSMRPASWGGPA